MLKHHGKRLFISGIPTAGKSYLAERLAEKLGGMALHLDDFRDELGKDPRYQKWVDFYLDKDEKRYLTETSPAELWDNLVSQSEALWPAFYQKIDSCAGEMKPIIFESVNILPHLARRDLDFPGLILLGSSHDATLERNIRDPRWGGTRQLQELEAKTFWEVERPRYKDEAEKFHYPAFETADDALAPAILLLNT